MLKSFVTHIFLLSVVIVNGQDMLEPSSGGGFEESIIERRTAIVLNNNEPVAELENAAEAMRASYIDSLMTFPAHDIYETWYNINIHAYDFDYKDFSDTLDIVMKRSECDFSHPFRGNITSNFGDRSARYHYGIDIKLYKGDPVKSAFEGVIRISQYSKSYGNVVVVRHNNGLETLYAHLSARKVKEGDHVEAGDVIGLGGNTGRSTGSHLHFECRFKGEPINPNDIINWEEGKLACDTLQLTPENFAYLKTARSKKYHTIRSGDTLSGIARKYGTSLSAICSLNGMNRNSTIYAGRKIRVR
ncbi:MAG: M23 family metallopeptidase [Flavobacteriales bacterium]|nr:M23 family metallopeptidase [Flavobacteriales bacterium]